MGSYNCSCKIGYELDTDEVTCIDINECDFNNGGCDGTCENTEGSYICLCPTGHHSLDGTGQNCTGLLTKAQKILLSITYCAIKNFNYLLRHKWVQLRLWWLWSIL